MARDYDEIDRIISHPRFCGVWCYRRWGEERLFSASVIANGCTAETSMTSDWYKAVMMAGEILDNTTE